MALWKLELREDENWWFENLWQFALFSGKRPSVSIENEKSEYAEITPPQPKEWLLLWRQDSCVFGRWAGDEEKEQLLGGQLANSVKQKQAKVEICQKCCGEIRQTKLQKSVELLFLERRHLPGPRWPVKTNTVFVIFSVNISYSNILHNLYILPKLFIMLCVWHIADSFNKSQMWQSIRRCLNACF